MESRREKSVRKYVLGAHCFNDTTAVCNGNPTHIKFSIVLMCWFFFCSSTSSLRSALMIIFIGCYCNVMRFLFWYFSKQKTKRAQRAHIK